MSETITIGSRRIGTHEPCFIIAEAGVNHNGSLANAKKLVDAAKEAGADAVKFQAFNTEELATKDAEKASYQDANDPRHKNQFEMLKSLELQADEFRELAAYCKSKGILFLCTPFDIKSVDLLESLNVPAYKIPSGEITNVPYLRYIAKKKKPMLISTGMANMDEVKRVLSIIYEQGNKQVALFQCVTSYPAPPGLLNLKAMETMQKEFKVPVGFSDHSKGIVADIVATALGACMIEKHFTLDKTMKGPDHKASLEPDELKEMIESIRLAEQMRGNGIKKRTAVEEEIMPKVRKGIYASKDIKKGEKITEKSVATKRPVDGIGAEEYDKVIGKSTKKDIRKGSTITWDDLS